MGTGKVAVHIGEAYILDLWWNNQRFANSGYKTVNITDPLSLFLHIKGTSISDPQRRKKNAQKTRLTSFMDGL